MVCVEFCLLNGNIGKRLRLSGGPSGHFQRSSRLTEPDMGSALPRGGSQFAPFEPHAHVGVAL